MQEVGEFPRKAKTEEGCISRSGLNIVSMEIILNLRFKGSMNNAKSTTSPPLLPGTMQHRDLGFIDRHPVKL